MASKAKETRIVIIMGCQTCKSRNYVTQKNRTKTTGRLELKKYCPRCRTHQPHREEK